MLSEITEFGGFLPGAQSGQTIIKESWEQLEVLNLYVIL
jgi:hypothetical protein